jgi:hypothetical protein
MSGAAQSNRLETDASSEIRRIASGFFSIR